MNLRFPTEKRAGVRKHDHRRSLWIIAGGSVLWCYRCGAWKLNVAHKTEWHRPTGPNGANPAMKEFQ